MTNLQKIETAIREALPELNEQLQRHNEINRHPIPTGDSLIQTELVPVTILHLLRWLDIINDKHSFQYSITDTSLYTTKPFKTYKLDLSKPLLSQQSQEVIDNLVKLVK